MHTARAAGGRWERHYLCLALRAFVLTAACSFAAAQPPIIFSGGVVNAASYTQPAASGSVVAIFGENLGDGVYKAASTPLPTSLGGTSVAIDGIPAPLFYVSPGQLNAQVPSSLTPANGNLGPANVVVTTSTGVSSPAVVTLYFEGPAVYTTDGSGCGPAAALNVAPDGSVSPNSASNSAAPGDFVELFGNGFGRFYFPPPDGLPAPAAQEPENSGWGFTIDGGSVLTPPYLGIAPGLVGTDQANIQIPMSTRDGCSVPITIAGSNLVSSTVSISVHSSRGQCVDPPAQSYGTIHLVKTIATGTSADGQIETLTASFPLGPQLVRPVIQMPQLSPGSYTENVRTLPAASRYCPVAGYTSLSAGPIVINGPKGIVTATPGQVGYSQTLPAGFVTAGTYNISAGGSSTVGGFQGTFSLGSPIQVTAVHRPGMPGDPLTVSWTGGSPGDIVKISLVNPLPVEYSSYAYTTAGAGSYRFTPNCSGNPVLSGGNGVYCDFGIPHVRQVVVEQMPAPDQVASFHATGITADIQASWIYRFVFGITGL